MLLPSFTRGSDQEAIAFNALVVGILRGVENMAQLSSSGQGEFLTLGDRRDLLRHATVPLNRTEIPIVKSQSRKRLKEQATGAIHVWKRPLLFAMRKAKNFLGSQLKGRRDVWLVQLLHRCFQIFAQLLTKLVPKSTRHSLAVADSPRVGRAAKPDDFQ